MKHVLFIGDVHGRTDWEKMLTMALPKFYHIVFLGDYVDSFDIRPVEIQHNLKKIIGYKKKYADRITCLLGNHDFAYIGDHFQTSGYNHHAAMDYKQFFQENHELFDVAWGYDSGTVPNPKYTLATHAGLTLTYYNNYVKTLIEDPESQLNKLANGKAAELPLHKVLNFMRNDEILWKVGYDRGGMGTPGPLWADFKELKLDPYPGITQVFGHSAYDTTTIDVVKGNMLVKVDGSMTKGTSNILMNI